MTNQSKTMTVLPSKRDLTTIADVYNRVDGGIAFTVRDRGSILDHPSNIDLVVTEQSDTQRQNYVKSYRVTNPYAISLISGIGRLHVSVRCRLNGEKWQFFTDMIDTNMAKDIANYIRDNEIIDLTECSVCMEHKSRDRYTVHFSCENEKHQTCDMCVAEMFNGWIENNGQYGSTRHMTTTYVNNMNVPKCPSCRAAISNMTLATPHYDVFAHCNLVVITKV